jgi:hypothetical protein
MATATLVPTSLTDSQSNVAAGAYTDIDNTIASASGTTLDSVTDEWTPSAGTGSAFTFGLSDLPSGALSVNTVQFRVRARTTAPGAVDDTIQYDCSVQGSNAPSTTAVFSTSDVGTGFINRGAPSPVTVTAAVSDVNAWTVRVYQLAAVDGTFLPGADDGVNLEIDEIEIIVDYNETPADPPSESPSGSTYTVIPTTDTSIYGLCIARVRDFVVLGGMDTDRYTIRWSALGDPTDWPTPATDDARSKQSGSQTFPTEFGYVTAIAGDDFHMWIFQERAISKATYVGGDIVFSFEILNEGLGCVRQGRVLEVDERIFFQSNRGFHMMVNGNITNIGLGKVDDSFS